MNTDLMAALTRLAKDELLQVHDGQGKGLAVFEGVAWVTQENDPRDRVLSRGETFTFDRPGLAIVQALSASSVLLFEKPQPVRKPRRPSTSVEWYLEARRQRAEAIGSALQRAFTAVRDTALAHLTPRRRPVSGA